ncbi:prostate stem cell antigen-like [Eublepharis macularius]|uniref:Prostate stem cell antigen-like n=1 Tax=Eublepharis macularius TaxID=481883 RepID=A0AA97JNF9_EUBMA|nr:prostate stem cell antigen-like [Eublepharis macularius]
MKPLLIFVLAGSLFVQPAGSLKCYTCAMQVSNSKCQGVKDCDHTAKACKTEVLSVIGVITLISKECALSCEAAFNDYTVAKRNVSCCDTEFCNFSGASGFEISYTKVALALCTSFALTFLRSGP